MQIKLSPSIKGLITSALMIAVFLGVYYSGKNAENRIQYLVYVIYALGIYWTVVSWRQSESFTGNFGDAFSQGFRCFIVVTLAIAIFYGIFNYLHPEFAEESAKALRSNLEESVNRNEIMPKDIEPQVAAFKKQYTLRLISKAIFGYLIIGAAVTAVLSGILTRRK